MSETPDRDDVEDRQMIELLNELRIVLPGVQMLSAFLLIVPFSDGFDKVTSFQRNVYFVTLLAGVSSAAFLIAPSAAHRVLFHQGERPWLIEHANRMAIAGLILLGVAMVGAILLVTDFLFDSAAVFVVPPLLAVGLAVLWFIRPLSRR